ncbi:MAG: DUF1176 domain-containing protein [Pseudomonadota bacterium]
MLPLLLALIAAPGPAPGDVKIFGDWAVACDNAKSCEMTSLYPGDGVMPAEGSGYDSATFSIERAPGPAGGFTVEVALSVQHRGEASIRVDGEVIAGGVPKNDILVFTGADAARIVAAMIKGKELSVTGTGGAMIGRVTLSGSSAALRYIDAGQGRAGTVTAAVAKGTQPASAVPAAVALPVVRFVRPAGRPVAMTRAMRAALDKDTGCGENYEGGDGGPPGVETHALGGGKTLALLPCGSGAYNFSAIPYIIEGGRAAIARFDYAPGETEAAGGTATLVNAGWDADTARLSSYDKGRGLGDCGGSEDYVWDGTMFRLVEARAMPDCRGSVNWLAMWRAAPVAQ